MMANQKITTILISLDTLKILSEIRDKMRLGDFDITIKYLLSEYEKAKKEE